MSRGRNNVSTRARQHRELLMDLRAYQPMGCWVLDKGKPRLARDLLEFGRFMSDPARILKQEHVGEDWISTVFLGVDHSFGGGPPVLWESMVFVGGQGGEAAAQARYRSAEHAMRGHQDMVEVLRAVMH